ncbi:MAG: sensor histidine kinase [Paludibacteraceae bacterium]
MKIKEIEHLLKQGSIDSLPYISFEKLPSVYLIYKNDKLIFWSDNQTEPVNLKNQNWEYKLLSNIHAITRSQQVGIYNIVVFIPIKHNYSYENEELKNTFFEGFNLNKEISIVLNEPSSHYAVYNSEFQYLFTLELPQHPIYNESWAIASMFMFLVVFLILFYLFARFPLLIGYTSLSWKSFFIVSLVMALFVFGCLWFSFPVTFFQNKIFTPYHYASNPFLRTLTHLSFLSIFLFALVFLFTFYMKRGLTISKTYKLKQIILLLVPALYFSLIFNFLMGVIFNSSTDVNILKIEDFSFVAVWNHLLFLLWGVSFMLLHVKIHRILIRRNDIKEIAVLDVMVSVFVCTSGYLLFGKYGMLFVISYFILSAVLYLPLIFSRLMATKWYTTIWLLFFTFFITWASVHMNQDKKFAKYKTLAENHYLNEGTDEDRLAIALLDDLNKNVINDKRIRYLVQFPDSISKANQYINNVYLRGFWNKYEMRLFATIPDTKLDKDYLDEISNWGRRVKTTNFYLMGNPNSDMTFLGAFSVTRNNNDNNNFYMEFYPKKYYKSYSFPDLLLETPPSIQSQLKLSSARYAFRELVNSTGSFQYRTDAGWIERRKVDYFTQVYAGYKHYVYQPNAYNYFVLSEKNDSALRSVLYFFYTYLLYICISLLTLWLHKLFQRETRVNFTFSSKFLYSFTILLALSFGLIFYVSVNYMRKKYVDDQKRKLENTKNYIQNALQEKYSWRESLDSTLTNELNFDLQDLSYTYKTDIHVYDNKGMLIASSQMPLFSRKLISRQISPLPYFSNSENMNQYEHIGRLEYLNAYTDFYNIDFLPIGYIAVPQFFSNDELRADLEDFLSVIINIYMIIIILFIALSLLIGRQLSAPLLLLQESLKKIKLGQRNQIINYKPRDEIGQLVEQYNRTVEELEQSAQLLARSERESAWRTMARQVAHEINNPLTPMKLTIQQLQRRKSMNDKHFDEYFEYSSSMLIEQIENLSKIASSFSSFAKLPEAKLMKVDIAKKISSVTLLFSNSNEDMDITYSGPRRGLFTIADREQLIQVFNNLLKNAVQAIPASRKGKIRVSLEATDKWIYIYIKDNGKGIEDEIKDKLFTPNFTTKSTGMGLGLSICHNIITILGGDITFETVPDEGTTFKISLPRISLSD